MAKLSEFKTTIGGGIRPNQFAVSLQNIPSIVNANGLLSKDFSFLCHATTIPGSNIGQAPVFHRGRMIPLAGERTFDPWTVTVYADKNMDLRRSFELWSNAINNYADNSAATTDPEIGGNGYKANGLVQLLDRNSTTTAISSWTVVGIFPINIAEMQLSWQANDVVGEFSVTFSVESFAPGGSKEVTIGGNTGTTTVEDMINSQNAGTDFGAGF
jgi:hypothetical protein